MRMKPHHLHLFVVKVTSALVDALFANVVGGWRYDFGLAAIPGVILLVGFFFCPESPRWLVQKGKHDEARNVLRKLRSVTCNIEEELKEIVNVCKEDEQVHSQNPHIEPENEHEREPLIVGSATTSFATYLVFAFIPSLSLNQTLTLT